MADSQTVDIVQAVVKYQNRVQAYAYAITRDFHLAQDIGQEVAVIVAKRWDHIPPEIDFLPWLRETVRRKSLEALRKHHRMPATLDEDSLEVLAGRFVPDGSGTQPSRDEPGFDVIRACLGQLKGAARQVIEARYGDEAAPSCEELAAQLNRSVQSIYALIKRARIVLARCIERGGRLSWEGGEP